VNWSPGPESSVGRSGGTGGRLLLAWRRLAGAEILEIGGLCVELEAGTCCLENLETSGPWIKLLTPVMRGVENSLETGGVLE